jgi:hypothetical protein
MHRVIFALMAGLFIVGIVTICCGQQSKGLPATGKICKCAMFFPSKETVQAFQRAGELKEAERKEKWRKLIESGRVLGLAAPIDVEILEYDHDAGIVKVRFVVANTEAWTMTKLLNCPE